MSYGYHDQQGYPLQGQPHSQMYPQPELQPLNQPLYDQQQQQQQQQQQPIPSPSPDVKSTPPYAPIPQSHVTPQNPSSRMRGTRTDICIGFAMVTFPMLIFNAIIIGIVAALCLPNSAETLRSEHAVYVDISATTFTTFTSWASTVAAVLGSFVLLLGSYPASRRFAVALRSLDTANLPTPYQFSMMVDIRSGSVWRTVLRLCTYMFGFRSKRAALPAALRFLSHMIFLGIVLSLLVAATDTWLHLTTKAVNVFLYAPSPGTNLGVSLLDRCLKNNNSYTAQFNFYFDRPTGDNSPACTLNPAATKTFLVTDAISGVEVLNNVSSTFTTKRYVDGSGQVFSYLAPVDTPETTGQDFSAHTYAMSTQCGLKSVECGLLYENMFGAFTPFNCTRNGWAGDIQSSFFQTRVYRDAAFTNTNTNPGFENSRFYFMSAAYLPVEWPHPENDPEVPAQVHGDNAIILNCTTTVYDVTYSIANGTIERWFARGSNDSVTNALATPITLTTAGTSAGHLALSFTGGTNTGQEYADNWAAEWSRIATSIGVTGLRASSATESMYRSSALVSRVPIAPLACLLVANFLYCVVGVVLAVLALLAVRDKETKEILERTSAQGVVAAMFEPELAAGPARGVDDMFAELVRGARDRVGIRPTGAGGYLYWKM